MKAMNNTDFMIISDMLNKQGRKAFMLALNNYKPEIVDQKY